MNDTFCIIKEGTEEFLEHLNRISQHTIKFTMELERNNTLPFLIQMSHPQERGGSPGGLGIQKTKTYRLIDTCTSILTIPSMSEGGGEVLL